MQYEKCNLKVEDVIKKYNLEKQDKNCFGDKIDFDFYQSITKKNNAETIITLENEMSFDLDDGKTYFLMIETFDYNKMKYNKIIDYYMPTQTTKIYELKKGE